MRCRNLNVVTLDLIFVHTVTTDWNGT